MDGVDQPFHAHVLAPREQPRQKQWTGHLEPDGSGDIVAKGVDRLVHSGLDERGDRGRADVGTVDRDSRRRHGAGERDPFSTFQEPGKESHEKYDGKQDDRIQYGVLDYGVDAEEALETDRFHSDVHISPCFFIHIKVPFDRLIVNGIRLC